MCYNENTKGGRKMDIRKLIEEHTEKIVKEKEALLHKHRVYHIAMGDELHTEEHEFLNNAPIEHSYMIIKKLKENEQYPKPWLKPWSYLHVLLRDVMENQIYYEPVNKTTIEDVEKFLKDGTKTNQDAIIEEEIKRGN